MAIIKKFKGNKIGSTSTAYWLGGSQYATQVNYITLLDRNNYALLEDANTTKHYFGDSTNDSLSLVPDFDKDLKFLDSLKSNMRNSFTRKMLFTSKPVLNCVRDHIDAETDEELYGSIYMNYSIKSNLDLDQLHTQGNLKTFEIGNDKFTLLVIPNQNGIGGGNQGTASGSNTAPGAKVILAWGADLAQAQFIEYDFDKLNLDMLSVNTADKIIYLMGSYDGSTTRNSSDGEYFGSYYPEQYVVALPFRTMASDNVFDFTAHKMLLHYEVSQYATGFSKGAYTNLFYLGRDDNDNDCFGILSSFPDLNSNNTLDLVLLRLDHTSFPNATTSTLLSNNRIQYLDCFDIHTISLNADPSNQQHYAKQHNSIPSKLFNFNAADPNEHYFYIPLFKNNGNLSPIAIKWDKGENTWTDAFTPTENLTSSLSIEGGANGDTTSHVVNPTAHLATLPNYAASYDAYWGTYITKDADDNHSLHFIFNYIGKSLYDDVYPTLTSKLNNCLSFGINTTTPTTLTYENLSTFDNLNAFLHKDTSDNTYTELVSLSQDGYKSYSYSQAGWTQSHHEVGTFTEYTQDSYSRRWAIEPPPQSSYTELVASGYMYYHLYDVKLHLISQVLPYTTSIEFTNTNLTYTGTPIISDIKVNAYDSSGNRIAEDVRLTIEGTNMNFNQANNATTTVVTTSAAQDTSVSIQITGPGYVNVSASFDI